MSRARVLDFGQVEFTPIAMSENGQKLSEAEGLRMIITEGAVLPKEGQRNVLITSALPYVNNVPHLGNIIGSTLSADVFARYSRTLNVPTLYICGTDEYGTATETKALEEGITPMELCTKFHNLHKEVYEWFEIGFDHFGRTSTAKHTDITQAIYKNIHRNGLFKQETADQTYCEDDGLFLADRFVEGICPQCGYDDARGDQCDSCQLTFSSPTELLHPRCKRNKAHKVSVRPSTHSCLRLDALQPRLEKWMQAARIKGGWGTNAVITDKGDIVEPRMLGDGLRPSAVTRDLSWGVPVPPVGNPEEDAAMAGKVAYVWFDAPIGYPSITANYTDEWERWWKNPKDVELYQFMGKDNVYFHTVFWPSVQLADGDNWTMLHNLSSTQYLNYEDTKFSKSRNIGVFGNNAKETGVPPDVWRYYLLSQRPENSDSAFLWSKFIASNNGELLNNLGNFVNRTIKFINAKFDSIVPGDIEDGANDADAVDAEVDAAFFADVNAKLAEFRASMDATKLRNGLSVAMAISSRGNQYLQENTLDNAFLAARPGRCGRVLLNAVNLIYLLTAVFHPFMPATSAKMLVQLNAPARSLPKELAIDILPGHKLGQAAHLFRKIENPLTGDGDVGEQEAKWKHQFGGGATATAVAEVVEKSKKQLDKEKRERDAAARKAAAEELERKKTPEMRALEEALAAQTERVKALRLGKAEGDVAKETEAVKALKAELAEMKKALV